MRKFFTLLLIVASFYGNAQTFIKSIVDPTSPYFVGAGILQNNNGTYNAFMHGYKLRTVGMDSTGNILWTKTVNNTGIHMEDDMAVDRLSDSTFIVGSNCHYTEYFYKYYLAKINTAGEPIWIKTLGGNDYDQRLHNMRHTDDGGSISVGTKATDSLVYDKAFVLKADSNGNVQWSKSYDGIQSVDVAYDAAETDNGFLVVGTTEATLTDSGSLGFMIKLDKLGNTMWRKGYKAPLAAARSIVKDGNSFVLAGDNQQDVDFTYSGDAILLKPAGNTATLTWAVMHPVFITTVCW